MRSVAIHSDLWVRFAYKVGPKSREGGIGRGRALDRVGWWGGEGPRVGRHGGLAMVGGTCNGIGVRGGVGVRVARCWARVRARREGGKDRRVALAACIHVAEGRSK